MSDGLLTISPVLFAHCGRKGRLAAFEARSGTRFRLAGERVTQLVTAFLEPRPADDAGFTPEEIDQARAAGILVDADESATIGLWERNGWSRPAYLLFSQMDIPYSDDPAANGNGGPDTRRRIVERYEAAGRPERRLLARGPAVELPAVAEVEPRLSSLTTRRSARAFSEVPPSAEQLAAVLLTGTKALRSVLADRAAGDPFLLLNSFYSWAHPFVVVQEVDGIVPGAYEYDPERHVLVTSAPPPDPEAVLASVQGQGGVLGPGFVIYLVADLRGYAWLYRHSRAYMNVLVQVGQLGQELLTAATGIGLAGWPSPAVHESRVAALLGLRDYDAIEGLSIVKLGRPRR